MNGKQAKRLRQVVNYLTVGLSSTETKSAYRKHKKLFNADRRNTQHLAKPKIERNPMKEIVGGKPLKKAIPICQARDSRLNRVCKGFIGSTGARYYDSIPRRYHPTKGFRKDGLFDKQGELAAIADRKGRLV